LSGASLGSRLARVRTLVVLSLVGAGSMLAAEPASAARVDFPPRPDGSLTLQIQGDPNETNDIVVSFDPNRRVYTIEERRPGGMIHLLPVFYGVPPCQIVSPTFNRIECDGTAVTFIDVALGDGDDKLTFAPEVVVPTLVTGGPGNDVISGGSGNDELQGHGGVDAIDGGAGNDTLFSEGQTASISSSESSSLSGGPGSDLIWGTNGNDTIDGGGGNDEVRAFGGDDTIKGGDGDDLLNGGDGNDAMDGGAGNDEVGTVITGSPGNVSLERGDDSMDGGPGDDLLRPGAGPAGGFSDNDFLRGGDGRDTVRFERRTEPVRASSDGVANDGQAGEADNVQVDVEQIVGGAGADTLVGGPGDDRIDGAGGDDFIDGLGGNDSLEGGTEDGGSDHIAGGPGNDALSGSAGDDSIDGGEGVDVASGGDGSDFGDGGAGEDRLSGAGGADTLVGGTANDDLDGGDGDDTLDGGEGNDTLKGSAGNDSLRGGPGADDLSGGDGVDVADYELTARVTVTLDDLAGDGAPGEGDNVRTDVEKLEGGGDEDTFLGSRRANTLNGASGEDYLDGASGADELFGGGSIDVVRARDGVADSVDCGRAEDLAIVDPGDKVKGSCERADDGVGTRPSLGRDVVVKPSGGRANASQADEGSVRFGLPDMGRTVPLQDRIELPVRSRIDATDGPVDVVGAGNGRRANGAANGGNGRQTATLEGAPFSVHQRRAKRPVLELRLRRLSARRDCHAGAGRKARSARHRARRRLGTKARGRIRTRGSHGSGTSRGTSWVMEDGCDGTLFRVQSGTLIVTDFGRDRRIRVRAGERYLAKARP
jgi:Ca2+-binding RTX toxin-like protein